MAPPLELRPKLALFSGQTGGPLPQTFPQLIKFGGCRWSSARLGGTEVQAGGEAGDVVDVGGEEVGGVGVVAGRACGGGGSGLCSDVLVTTQREMPPSLPL